MTSPISWIFQLLSLLPSRSPFRCEEDNETEAPRWHEPTTKWWMAGGAEDHPMSPPFVIPSFVHTHAVSTDFELGSTGICLSVSSLYWFGVREVRQTAGQYTLHVRFGKWLSSSRKVLLFFTRCTLDPDILSSPWGLSLWAQRSRISSPKRLFLPRHFALFAVTYSPSQKFLGNDMKGEGYVGAFIRADWISFV